MNTLKNNRHIDAGRWWDVWLETYQKAYHNLLIIMIICSLSKLIRQVRYEYLLYSIYVSADNSDTYHYQ